MAESTITGVGQVPQFVFFLEKRSFVFVESKFHANGVQVYNDL